MWCQVVRVERLLLRIFFTVRCSRILEPQEVMGGGKQCGRVLVLKSSFPIRR